MMVESLVKTHSVEEIKPLINKALESKKRIGFVPTMGALHAGHISLVEKAKKECDLVIVSIFVNPTQFNNAEDLKTYPRREEEDVLLLQSNGCDIVFMPSVENIYPKGYQLTKVDLGFLAETMDGKFRPGHFDGVVAVVSRLFNIVQPTRAYFGEKDFQQVAVIRKMTALLNLPVQIVSVGVMREQNGLAMSSRNLRLSESEKDSAALIFQTLEKGKEWAKTFSPEETCSKMAAYFSTGNLDLEYLKIVHPTTLEEIKEQWVSGATACIAAFCGQVRLIDNMQLVE